MNRLFFLCIFFLAFSNFASAAVKGPLPGYFKWADTAYLVRVTSVEKDKVTFAVTETLRGKSVPALILRPTLGNDFKPNSEWLLISCIEGRQDKDAVGWLLDGYCGWLPTPVVRDNGEVYVQDHDRKNNQEIVDKAADGTEGLTLGHIKKLLQEHPFEP